MASTSTSVEKVSKSSKKDGHKKSTKEHKKRKSENVEGADPVVVEKKSSKKKKSEAASKETTPSPSSSGATAPSGAPTPRPSTPEVSTGAASEAQPSLESTGLSAPVCQALRKRGVESLFPIQSACLPPLLSGRDVIGRARTGCGKTLAFVLPIVELLLRDGPKRAQPGKPLAMVLAPTRELARQVAADFESIGTIANVRVVCVYGGAPMHSQVQALRRGVEVVVGTPGRVKDLMERGNLAVDSLLFRVLDECDEMLNMGFVDDVERILGAVPDPRAVQTLLFSATLPEWVKNITAKFLKTDAHTVDLVGDSRMKASQSVRHLVLPCHWSQRASVTRDLVAAYAPDSKTVVFTETKRDADELASALGEHARALHGDVAQATREVVLAGFRGGKFNVLVATDVAARGLDIKDIDLVVQSEPPIEPETYVHRSGRTGRAHATGVCVTLVDRRKEGLIPRISKRVGVPFERIGAPQPSDIARAAGNRVASQVASALSDERDDDGVRARGSDLFLSAADAVLAAEPDARRALAAALARAAGHVGGSPRSLLTAREDSVTLQLVDPAGISRPSEVYSALRRALAPELAEEAKSVTLTKDGRGALFDVAPKLASQFLKALPHEDGSLAAHLVRPDVLPPIVEREVQPSSGGGWGGRGGGRGGGFGGGRGGGFGGGRGGGFGGGRGGGRGGNRRW